jgi:hypothetical protein
LGLVASALTLVTTAAPAQAGIGCRIDSLSGSVAVYEQPDTSSAAIGSITSYRYGGGCARTSGATYTECGGGSSYFRVMVAGRTGYTPAACFDWSYY